MDGSKTLSYTMRSKVCAFRHERIVAIHPLDNEHIYDLVRHEAHTFHTSLPHTQTGPPCAAQQGKIISAGTAVGVGAYMLLRKRGEWSSVLEEIIEEDADEGSLSRWASAAHQTLMRPFFYVRM